jgi:Zn-dependent peptidase ImmA (M78 family)/transcriptional regulator with XRE-family HTH domain
MGDLVLAQRLRKMRKSLGLKLTEASQRLGFSSYQILSNIEDGKREVKVSELITFSRVYYCSVDKLLGHEERDYQVTFVWRNPPHEKRTEIEKDILYRCEQYSTLEKLLNRNVKESLIEVSVEDIKTHFKVRQLALQMSKLLSLGRRPAFTLQKVLEHDFGVKVLYYSFNEGSSVSAVIPQLGKIIVINKDEAHWRQNFDLAHELFHLITWDVVVVSQNYHDERYSNDIERKADIFASALLLPDDEVRSEVINRAEITRQLSYSDIVDIAIEFGVSTQALVYRLFHLKFISSFEEAREIAKDMELQALSRQKRTGEERESEQFIALAIRCLRKGLISRGKFAELAGIEDRSDIDDFISERGLMEEEGNSIEIMAS